MKAVEDEVKLRQPKLTHRMILLNTKRGSDRHSDFLEKIVENYSVVEFEQMIGKELMIHLFIWDADPQISKLATEILKTEKTNSSRTQNQSKRDRGSCMVQSEGIRKDGEYEKGYHHVL